MMKCEFEERIGKPVLDGDYDIIEFVYTWHPNIDYVHGKDQIAAIYMMPEGMSFIHNMLPLAKRAKEYRNEMDAKRRELDRVQKEFAEMCEKYKKCEF